MKFDEFELDPRCVRVLHGLGIEVPTPVQEQAIPVVLAGKDLIATAQTGTGKTLAFALPTLSRLADGKPAKNQMLVLVPTRELAIQVHGVIKLFESALGVRATLLYGGVGMQPQIDSLRKGSSIIVATPGRLLDHMSRGTVKFDTLRVLVLDEADRMLDMGFMPDLRRIMSKLPKQRQTLMFSATFADEMERLAKDMLHEPSRITVGRVSKPVDAVRQVLFAVQQHDKAKLLLQVLDAEKMNCVIIFLRTKDRTERLMHSLRKSGHKAEAIHGDRSQRQRQSALEGFKSGKYKILVATDVAARGLDVDGISHVINYDIPQAPDDYIHRIGRTARAEAEGDAITFVCPDEFAALAGIEKALGRPIPRQEWEGAPPLLSTFRPEGSKGARPKQRSLLRRRGGGGGRRR